MNYVAKVGGREIEITVSADSGSNYEVIVDGVHHIVDARCAAGHLWSILHGNRSIDIDVFKLPGEEFEILVNGSYHKFSLMNEQRRAMFRTGGRGATGRAMLTSPMPGKVVKLLVEKGQEVQTDQGLIIIEAMKMENELKSVSTGRIAQIFVKEGDVVESGAELLLIE